MAAANLLALIDDITTVLDDISVLTKVAAKKTAGVLGDDLALNAQQVTGVDASRELPVVWAVAKGSLVNKAILVPAALAISAWAPWLITPLLMLGGAYLCFEGFEKVWHRLRHGAAPDAEQAALVSALADPAVDLVALEKDKIKGAIRTDFILSAEIITLTLGSVSSAPLATQFGVMALVALVLTLGVYGLVAAIVKMDDAGLALSRLPGQGTGWNGVRAFGRGLLRAAPWLMKTLSVLGTAAMFLVGGGILAHGLPFLHHGVEAVAGASAAGLAPLVRLLAPALLGVLAGALVLMAVSLIGRLRGQPAH